MASNRRTRLQLAFSGWIPDGDPDELSSDDWYTPPELVAEIADALDGIDLDPCWSPRSFVRPLVAYTELGVMHLPADAASVVVAGTNGLAHPWIGVVHGVDVRTRFVNPPYSQPGPWLRELADLHNAYPPGVAGRSIALIRIDTSTWWWQLAWEADAICWLRARVPFVRPGSAIRSQPRDHHALLFWGDDPAEIRERWEWLGHVDTRLCTECTARRELDEWRREQDAAQPRTHERSSGHVLLEIDGIPADTYPFLPTDGAPEHADPNATTVTLSIDEIDSAPEPSPRERRRRARRTRRGDDT